jgi:hypothetical protein
MFEAEETKIEKLLIRHGMCFEGNSTDSEFRHWHGI